MTTQLIDIYIPQGIDWEYDFPIDTPDDLTGAAATMQIRTETGATFIASLSSANGDLVIDVANQKITAKIPNSRSVSLVPGYYLYDMKVADAQNKYFRSVQGSAYVDGQVTITTPPIPANNPLVTEDGLNITTESGDKITT